MKENIVIYDQKFHLACLGTRALDNEFVEIIHRAKIVDPKAEIFADKPSLIVVHFDLQNDVEKIKELIAATTQFRDYFPYVVLFNYNDETVEVLRNQLEYHFVLVTKATPDLNLVIKILQLYRKKKMDKETLKASKKMAKIREKSFKYIDKDESLLLDHKVYKEFTDPKSIFLYPIEVEIICMNEFEIIFKSYSKITIGEIFRLNKPFDMQLVVVTEVELGVFRATIHFVNETDKFTLQGFVAEIAELNKQGIAKMYPQDLQKIKNKHFILNSSSSL